MARSDNGDLSGGFILGDWILQIGIFLIHFVLFNHCARYASSDIDGILPQCEEVLRLERAGKLNTVEYHHEDGWLELYLFYAEDVADVSVKNDDTDGSQTVDMSFSSENDSMLSLLDDVIVTEASSNAIGLQWYDQNESPITCLEDLNYFELPLELRNVLMKHGLIVNDQ